MSVKRVEDSHSFIRMLCDADFRNSKTNDDLAMSAMNSVSVGFVERVYQKVMSQGGE